MRIMELVINIDLLRKTCILNYKRNLEEMKIHLQISILQRLNSVHKTISFDYKSMKKLSTKFLSKMSTIKTKFICNYINNLVLNLNFFTNS